MTNESDQGAPGPSEPSSAGVAGGAAEVAGGAGSAGVAFGDAPFVWSLIDRAPQAAAAWPRWLASGRHLDPYLVWADLTRYAGFGGLEPNNRAHGGKLSALLEVRFPVGVEAIALQGNEACAPTCDDLAVALSCLEIPGLYKVASNGIERLARRFFTARLLPASLQQLLCCADVVRVQLGVPRIPATEVNPTTRDAAVSSDGLVPRTVIGIIDDGCAFAHPSFCNQAGETRVHYLWDQDRHDAADRIGAASAMRAVDAVGSFDSMGEGVGYGREFRHKSLSVAARLSLTRNDPLCAYLQLDYAPIRLNLHQNSTSFTQPSGGVRLPGQAMRSGAHGTGVMYMAAGVSDDPGHPHPLDVQRAVAHDATSASTLAQRRRAPKDYASAWPIAFVQLPTRTTLDTSGGSLGVHVLDGLHYLIDRATRIAYDQREKQDGAVDTPVYDEETGKPKSYFFDNGLIVNISYGALAGGHDGTSIAEMAIADVVSDPKKISALWVCTAAGNGHAARAHARATLRAGGVGSFLWSVGPDNPLESFLEIWLPDVDVYGDSLPADSHERFRISVWPPGFEGMCQVTCGQARLAHRGADLAVPVAGVFYSGRVAQGMRGTMVLVAVARTRPNGVGEAISGGVGVHGQWRVDVAYMDASDERPVDVHAWTERNDLLFGNLRSQQSRVLAEVPIPEPTEFMPEARALLAKSRAASLAWVADPLQPRYTMSSLAGLAGPATRDRKPDTGEFFKKSEEHNRGRLVVAGAYRMADGEVATYSSGGPSRHENPRHQRAGRITAQHSVYSAVYALPRTTVDVMAPADIGTALRGLRVAGTRPGQWVRLSGTSLAAPSVARVIANEQHVNNLRRVSNLSAPPPPQRANLDLPTAFPEPERRATLTPQADDLFRRGAWRVW